MARRRAVGRYHGRRFGARNLVQRVVDHLRTQFAFGRVEEVEVIEENVKFPLPRELAAHAQGLTQIST